MNSTKNKLLKLVDDAQLGCDDSAHEILSLMYQAVVHGKDADIDWYIMNDLLEIDVLLFIALSDTDLSIHFNDNVIIEAVRYVFRVNTPLYH